MCDLREQIPLAELLRKSRRVRDCRLNVKFRLFCILSTRIHDFMDRSLFLLFIHEMPCFRGQELHKAGWLYLPAAVPCKSFLIFHYHPGICRFFRMSQPQLYVSSGKDAISPDRKTVFYRTTSVDCPFH